MNGRDLNSRNSSHLVSKDLVMTGTTVGQSQYVRVTSCLDTKPHTDVGRQAPAAIE